MLELLVYFVVVTIAELLGTLGLTIGVGLLYVILLITTIIRSAMTRQQSYRRLALPLSLVPLARLIMLAIPLPDLPPIILYYLSYALLIPAAAAIMSVLRYRLPQVRLTQKALRIQLAILPIGIVAGFVEYLILAPEPLVSEFTLMQLWLPTLVLILCGALTEFVFRGLIQPGLHSIFNKLDIFYVGGLYTIIHVSSLYTGGYISTGHGLYLPFTLGLAILYGWIVRKTGLTIGVAIAHGLSLVASQLVLPFLI